ncbi:hypothetical protein D3C72_1143640 [compost metagenome]
MRNRTQFLLRLQQRTDGITQLLLLNGGCRLIKQRGDLCLGSIGQALHGRHCSACIGLRLLLSNGSHIVRPTVNHCGVCSITQLRLQSEGLGFNWQLQPQLHGLLSTCGQIHLPSELVAGLRRCRLGRQQLGAITQNIG